MTISRILAAVLFMSSLATPHLSAMEPRPSASNSLSLPQTYHTLFEQFISAAGTDHMLPELLEHIMQFHYHSDPIAFAKDLWIIVTNMEQAVMQARFNQLKDHPESLLKMALRLGYAKKFGENIPDDELNVVDFVENYKKYGVNDFKFSSTDLFKQPYLEHVLPLLELLIEEPVTALRLYESELTALPESIGNLVNLKVLNLANNRLTVLPESFDKLVNLEVLRLNNNQLTAQSESIGNLVNLKGLSLSDNQLKEVPESIGKLENLEWLYLYDNKLTQNTKDWLLQQFSDLGDYLWL